MTLVCSICIYNIEVKFFVQQEIALYYTVNVEYCSPMQIIMRHISVIVWWNADTVIVIDKTMVKSILLFWGIPAMLPILLFPQLLPKEIAKEDICLHMSQKYLPKKQQEESPNIIAKDNC